MNVGDSMPGAPEYDPEEFHKFFRFLGAQVYAFHCKQKPVTHQFCQRAMFWNLTSLRSMRTPTARNKIGVIAAHLRNGPVLLAETKGDKTWASQLMTKLGVSKVYAAEAVPSDGGFSGGVAVVLPTHMFGREQIATTLVDGYVLQVTDSDTYSDMPMTFVAVYLKPGKELPILQEWQKAWTRVPPKGRILIGGDFNRLFADHREVALLFSGTIRALGCHP
jgi:hypothetical protein